MNKKPIILLIAIAVLLVTFSCTNKKILVINDIRANGFKDKVKKVTISYFENENKRPGEEQIVKQSHSVIEYNDQGKKTSQVLYNKDGSIFLEGKFEYNEEGLIKGFDYQIPELYTDMVITLDYSSDNKVTGLTAINEGELSYTTTIEYDEKGNISRVKYFDEDEELYKKIEYSFTDEPVYKSYLLIFNSNTDEFDDVPIEPVNLNAGHDFTEPIFTHKFFKDNDTLLSIIVSKLNVTGNLAERRIYEDEETLTEKITFKTDQDGRITEYIKTNAQDKMIDKRTASYNPKTKIFARKSFYWNDSLKYIDYIHLDKQETLDYFVRKDQSDKIRRKQEYIYDKKSKTLTKRILSRKDELYERSIYTFDKQKNVTLYEHFITFNEEEARFYYQELEYEYWK